MTFPVADAHCDFLYYMTTQRWDIGRITGKQVIYLPYLQAGGVRLQFFAAWMDAELRKPFWKQCTAMLDAYDAMLEAHPDALTSFSPAFDPTGDKIACVLSVEGGEVLEGELSRLDTLHARGVRAMTLTWNNRTELAYPAMGRRESGLTRLGKAAVDKMCALGIAIDLAHLNEAGIDDVLERATRPVLASHSNARAVHENKRSLRDSHIRAIAQSGGIVCVNYYPQHLCKGTASRSDVLRHIEHIAGLVGVEHVGLGSDFDGMNAYPKDLRDSRDVQTLLQELVKHGYTEEQVARIAYGNLRDYIVQFC